MSETQETLRRKISGAQDLSSVVHAMKVMAASNIVRFQQAAKASAESFSWVELALATCLKTSQKSPNSVPPASAPSCVILFGTDQGLVGRFNEEVAEHFFTSAKDLGPGPDLIVFGLRLASVLQESSIKPAQVFGAASTVGAIVPQIGQAMGYLDSIRNKGELGPVWIFYNRAQDDSSIDPQRKRIMPIDPAKLSELSARKWPTQILPEVMSPQDTLPAVLREYLFLSLYLACAESLAAENASRLASMRRADDNIQQLLTDLSQSFHRTRQQAIDEELFDVVSGFQAVL